MHNSPVDVSVKVRDCLRLMIADAVTAVANIHCHQCFSRFCICFPQHNNGKANLMTAALHSLRCLQKHLYQSPCEHAVMFLCQQESRFAARVLC